jgi:hypothetical protein
MSDGCDLSPIGFPSKRGQVLDREHQLEAKRLNLSEGKL